MNQQATSSLAGLVESAKGHSRPVKVLIVEDEAIVAADLADQLSELGYEISGIADSAVEALALVASHHPDVVLMDIVIKGHVDGIDVAAQIARNTQTPVIFVTAFSDAATIKRAATTGPYGFLTKPYQVKEVRASIEVALFKCNMERRLRVSEQWFASALRCVADGVIAVDAKGLIYFMNPVAEMLLGVSLEQVLGRDSSEVVHLETPQGLPLESPFGRVLSEGSTLGLRFGDLLRRDENDYLPVDHSAAPILDQNGVLLGAVAALRDVSERQSAENALRVSEERFRTAFDFAPVGMALITMDGYILQTNPSLCSILQRSEAELLGSKQQEFSCAEDLSLEARMLQNLFADDTPTVQFEKRYLAPDGQAEIWTLVSVSVIKTNTTAVCYLYQIFDISLRKAYEARLAYHAHFDSLTDLPNRARLTDELSRMVLTAARKGSSFAVLFIDVDHFKQINDTLGHDLGDVLLQSVAQRLKNALRGSDFVARLGGDEFVVLLSDTDSSDIVGDVTQKLMSTFQAPVLLGSTQARISLSVGVSLFPQDAQAPADLLKLADSALYQAKAEGRNNVQFYRPELTARLRQRMELDVELRQAIEAKQLEVYYQPVMPCEVAGQWRAEALLRWQHPQRGLIEPIEFIEFAEESGLILPMGEWVLREACQAAMRWPHKNGQPLLLSVNVSARQFKLGDLCAIVQAALQNSGLPAERLCLEITEQVLMHESEKSLATLARLKSLGVSIAIDDFGIGLSSLSYIRRFSPEILKIDRSFVSQIGLSEQDDKIVAAIAAMANSMGLTIVAEGVETPAQLSFMQALGCQFTQGYLHARAMPDAALQAWLNA